MAVGANSRQPGCPSGLILTLTTVCIVISRGLDNIIVFLVISKYHSFMSVLRISPDFARLFPGSGQSLNSGLLTGSRLFGSQPGPIEGAGLMRFSGLILIAAALIAPLYWFFEHAALHDPAAIFSQYLGSAALIAMGIVQLLATRMRGLEFVFGGLDRIYVLHKWLAVGAIAALALHDIIDAELRGLRGGSPLAGIAEDVGEISLYGLLILALASIITFIPYHLWKWTHRFIGAFFALGAFHFFFIDKPFQTGDALGLYISAFCVLGLASYVYCLIIRPFIGGKRYRVSALQQLADVTEIVLKPEGRGFKHKPGQFAIVQFDGEALREPHPFTLSDAPDKDGSLRFSVKTLGDYTTRLPECLKPGMTATVQGPFGHFRMPRGNRPQIWVAAGIGITPFLAFARSLDQKNTGPIMLYYSVRAEGDIPYLDELQAAATNHAQLSFQIFNSARGERLTADHIVQAHGHELARCAVYYCGPETLRKDLKSQLCGAGLPSGGFHYEAFEMRSGIGLRKLGNWLLDLVLNRLERRSKTPAEETG